MAGVENELLGKEPSGQRSALDPGRGSRDARPIAWATASPLRAVACWIIFAGFVFCVDGIWTFVRSFQQAERHVVLVKQSGHELIRHEGQIHTQAEIVRMLRRAPYWDALPHVALALCLCVCAWLAFRWPFWSTLSALGFVLVGSAIQLSLLPRIAVDDVVFHLFVVLLLLLGLKSSWSFERTQRGVCGSVS